MGDSNPKTYHKSSFDTTGDSYTQKLKLAKEI